MVRRLEDAESPAYVDRILVVERDRFRLTLYDLPMRGAVVYGVLERYPIAIGAKGHATPRGMYRINSKIKDPAWTRPYSDWVPKELQGTVVEGGTPENPLKERWMGVTEPEDGIGIHGTGDLESLGSAASHGCIRMDPDDVKELYKEVPLGAPHLHRLMAEPKFVYETAALDQLVHDVSHTFAVVGGNGEVQARSERYTTERDARRGAADLTRTVLEIAAAGGVDLTVE